MTYPVIKATHYIGLAALLGGPAFWYLIWRPARKEIGMQNYLPSDATVALTIRATMLVGLVLFAFSGVLDIMRAGSELFGFLEWDYFYMFATGSDMGRMIVARVALSFLFFLSALRLPTAPRTFAWSGPLLSGFAIIASISLLSHQAGKDSPFPVIFDMIHLVATALWGGGLLYFALVPWRTMRNEPSGRKRLASVANLFSVLGLLAVATLTVTGIYISVQQFHSMVAVTQTSYGMQLIRKLAVYFAIIGVAGVHHLYFVPGLTDKSNEKVDRMANRFLRLVRIEALLVLVLLVVVGFLTTQMPPERPVGLIDVPNQSGTYGDNRYHLAVIPRDQGQLMFELLVEDGDGYPVEILGAQLDLTMLEHYMPPYVLRLEPAEPGVYRGTGILSMGGRWHVTLDIDWAEDEFQQVVLEFDTRASLRDSEFEKTYSWQAIIEKRFGVFWLLFFTVLTAVGGYALIKGLRQPKSVLLTTLGLLVFLGGAFQMARVAEEPGPYTYRKNPVRRTAEVIARGAELYQANCLVCHGIEGRGDGPAAASLNPPPANFITPDDFEGTGMRAHADGEIYWTITKGVRGSSMPPFEHILTDEERWILVRYVRHLSGDPY